MPKNPIVTISYVDLLEKVSVIGNVSLDDIGLKYALFDRFLSQVKTKQKQYLKELRKIELETALKDPKTKRVMTENNGSELLWDEEGLKLKDEKVAELNEKMVEITTYLWPITDEAIEKLGPFVIEMLSGIVFPEKEVEELRKELYTKARSKPKYPHLRVEETEEDTAEVEKLASE